ncbi:monofunctional biosynthetic peptidoglycan transglycosylase [Marilutibacter alkalisoli]|uniref:Biosynthetic peptidoglycan transglycosylase n=1 Tax=Marilutibacter alkalisoli TaxID=2591633 RepID=A0A514BPJ0_9GAMM|nr:monofunctional biosynthetic peptidoglycan transglycosylase [Lysobacter alkalisoli]QDH69294.1 monofunctional biosynthetic peptidoglycan transglycosylase [Lysobacter alkalisoli]
MGRSQGRSSSAGRRGRLRRGLRWLLALPLLAMLASVLQVAVLRFVDPPLSAFMVARQFEAWQAGDWRFRIAYDWRDLEAISPQLPLAVIASEDQRFAEHRGFDLKAIEKAIESNERGGRVRGGSTISQQTAKNLFLWSGRSWLRKGIEAWYTLLIEVMWPKTRIIEVYLNVAEFGDGVYGAQAAARTYYGIDADRLGPAQAARMAAVLPSPRRYSIAQPGPYVQRRTVAIQRQMRSLGGTAYLERLD